MSELERVLQRLARLLRGDEDKPPAADCGEQLQMPAFGEAAGDRPGKTAPDLNEPGATSSATR
jgi:hypothetical protein